VVGHVTDSRSDHEFIIDLPDRTFIVRGKVVAPDGHGVPGVEVSVDHRAATSGADGTFEIEGFSWQPGRVTGVKGVPEGMSSHPRAVSEPKDGVIEVEVALRPVVPGPRGGLSAPRITRRPARAGK
jgi:hypothetical protein